MSDGYFNNYLFPKNWLWLPRLKHEYPQNEAKAKKAQIEKEIQQAKETAESSKLYCKNIRKIGKLRKLFGSVTTKEISRLC